MAIVRHGVEGLRALSLKEDAVIFLTGLIIGLIIIGPIISFLLFNWYPVYKDHKLARQTAQPLTEQFLNSLGDSDLALYGTCNWGFLQRSYKERLVKHSTGG